MRWGGGECEHGRGENDPSRHEREPSGHIGIRASAPALRLQRADDVQPATAVSVPPSPELRRKHAAAPKLRLAAPVPLHAAAALLALDACNAVAERRVHCVRDLMRYGPPAAATW